MKKLGYVISIIIILFIIIIVSGLIYFKINLGPVNKNNKQNIIFTILPGDTYYSISSKLHKNKLIRSEDVYRLYIKVSKPSNELRVGDYYLNQSMDVQTILDTLSGNAINSDITITFKEGKNMRSIAKTIEDNTNNTVDDVYNKLNDKEYLNKLIGKYWFIDNSILDDKLYYSLEGYLSPNTYKFKSKDVTVEEIFTTLLNQREKELESLKDTIINHKNYNVHDFLTLASMIELEAKSDKDRIYVSSVFYNRINKNMSLGSDVTTYYDSKVDMSERDLYKTELMADHGYNTRSTNHIGLPIGPICNPSISSIKAAVLPAKSNYLYFVADNTGKVYFASNYSEHLNIINKLKVQGLWERY